VAAVGHVAGAELVRVERVARDELQAIAEAARQLDARVVAVLVLDAHEGAARGGVLGLGDDDLVGVVREQDLGARREEEVEGQRRREARRHEVAGHRLAEAVREVDVQRVPRAEEHAARARELDGARRELVEPVARARDGRTCVAHARRRDERMAREGAALVARVEGGLPVGAAVVRLARPAQIEARRGRLKVVAVIGLEDEDAVARDDARVGVIAERM